MKGNYDAAIALFGEVIQSVPNYANVYFNRGELLFEQQNYAAALQDYSVAIELAPQDAQYYNSRGHALFMLEKHNEAIGELFIKSPI
jgi:tetratricopeptide (TPR) repeat protein